MALEISWWFLTNVSATSNSYHVVQGLKKTRYTFSSHWCWTTEASVSYNYEGQRTHSPHLLSSFLGRKDIGPNSRGGWKQSRASFGALLISAASLSHFGVPVYLKDLYFNYKVTWVFQVDLTEQLSSFLMYFIFSSSFGNGLQGTICVKSQ